MRVWMHKQSGKLMISWQCYAMWSEVKSGVTLQCPIYVGEACENENGVTVIFPQSIYNDFEFIGDL